MPTDCLRKLRLLCEDFPRSHNLVLIGQPPLMQALTLSINEEIRSRVTAEGLSWLKGPSKKPQRGDLFIATPPTTDWPNPSGVTYLLPLDRRPSSLSP